MSTDPKAVVREFATICAATQMAHTLYWHLFEQDQHRLRLERGQRGQRLPVVVEAVEVREGPPLAQHEGIRRRGQRLVHRQRRQAELARARRVELDLPRRGGKDEVRMAHVGDPARAAAT